MIICLNCLSTIKKPLNTPSYSPIIVVLWLRMAKLLITTATTNQAYPLNPLPKGMCKICMHFSSVCPTDHLSSFDVFMTIVAEQFYDHWVLQTMF